MAKTSVSIDIARTPAAVFAFMADPETMGEWTNMEHMVMDGPFATGASGSFDLPMMGRRRSFRFVVTGFETDRRMAMRILGRMGMVFDYQLIATAGGGTRVREDIEVKPRGLLRLVSLLLVRMVGSEERNELKRLKAALEAAPKTAGRAAARA